MKKKQTQINYRVIRGLDTAIKLRINAKTASKIRESITYPLYGEFNQELLNGFHNIFRGY